jgi:hypothetical protein
VAPLMRATAVFAALSAVLLASAAVVAIAFPAERLIVVLLLVAAAGSAVNAGIFLFGALRK